LSSNIPSDPSLEFTRKIWWDSLLSLYYSPSSGTLTPTQRTTAALRITRDLEFAFQMSNYWFSFIHLPSFFGTYDDPSARQHMQPSLLLSLLAISTFWRSSERELGRPGREWAMRFRSAAQCALEASVNARRVDEGLAQSAWVTCSLLLYRTLMTDLCYVAACVF
jgi:hypothetical protein